MQLLGQWSMKEFQFMYHPNNPRILRRLALREKRLINMDVELVQNALATKLTYG